MTMVQLSPVLPGLVLAVGLAACASPSPRFLSAARQEVSVEGSRFAIYVSGDEVEIYRTSPELLPRLSQVRAKAEQAVRLATGCAVEGGSMVGDAALLKATLDCG